MEWTDLLRMAASVTGTVFARLVSDWWQRRKYRNGGHAP